MNTYQDLKDFIIVAENNRKYLPIAVANFKPALKLLDSELTEEEKQSVDLISQHLDEIFNHIYSSNKSNLSVTSLEVYKKRIRRLVSDYKQYGTDPKTMASWNRKIITKKHKEKESTITRSEGITGSAMFQEQHLDSSEFQAADLVLTNGKARIVVPRELTIEDAKKLRAQINLLAGIYPDEK